MTGPEMVAALVGFAVGAVTAWSWVTSRVVDRLTGRIRSSTDGEVEIITAVLMALLPDWLWRLTERIGARR